MADRPGRARRPPSSSARPCSRRIDVDRRRAAGAASAPSPDDVRRPHPAGSSFPLEYHAEVLGDAAGDEAERGPADRLRAWPPRSGSSCCCRRRSAAGGWRRCAFLTLPVALVGRLLAGSSTAARLARRARGLLAVFGIAARNGIVLVRRFQRPRASTTASRVGPRLGPARRARAADADRDDGARDGGLAVLPFVLLGNRRRATRSCARWPSWSSAASSPDAAQPVRRSRRSTCASRPTARARPRPTTTCSERWAGATSLSPCATAEEEKRDERSTSSAPAARVCSSWRSPLGARPPAATRRARRAAADEPAKVEPVERHATSAASRSTAEAPSGSASETATGPPQRGRGATIVPYARGALRRRRRHLDLHEPEAAASTSARRSRRPASTATDACSRRRARRSARRS